MLTEHHRISHNYTFTRFLIVESVIVAIGTVITGLAAGLKPRIVSWPTNEPAKRFVLDMHFWTM